MAKDKNGRFAREDFAPELQLERFWNVKHFVFALSGVLSNTYSVTSINTGMEIDEELGDADPQTERPLSRKWVVKGAVWRPRTKIAFASGGAMRLLETIEEMDVVLRKPTVAPSANFDRMDAGVIGASKLSWAEGSPLATEHAGHVFQWPVPLDILTPTPVWSETLEIACATAVHDAEWLSVQFVMSILYGWAPAYINDILAGRQIMGG